MIAIGSYFVFIMFVMETTCDIPRFSYNSELICNDTQLYENNEIGNNSRYIMAICVSSEQKQFFKDILNEHNKYRRMHGAPDLVLNEELSESTRDPVINYGLIQEKIPQGFNYNQKPFLTSSKLNAALAEEIVADWYNTGANYNYDTEPSSETADPFTQIVWNETEKIGAAVLWIENVLYVAVSYIGVGNTKGDNHYINNVQRPQIL